ncbi:MAG: helix-turn-helix domain-containing protein [Treponema sp.]|nr:helix-turn-helix domain-containing protein [Treponema sp.]
MESYGSILREARESKGLSIERVAAETAITKQYIEALENDDQTGFHGEAYLTGFLQNYSDYLGTDTKELLRLYHAMKLQESPTPKELLEKTRPKFLVPLIVAVCVLLFCGVGVFLYFYVFKIPEKKEIAARAVAENKKIHQYSFDGSTQNARLYLGDQILIPTENGGNIVLTVSNTQGYLSVLTPAGEQVVDLSEERDIDLTNDGITDIILYVSDIDMKDGSRGAEVRMLLKDREFQQYIEITDGDSTSRSDIEQARASGQLTVHTDTRAYPFTANISFRGSCVFRYRSDRKEVVENYYQSGEVINVTSNNGLRIWASNINALKIQLIAGLATYDFEIGKAGEVVVEDIKWVKDSNGMYSIVVENVN